MSLLDLQDGVATLISAHASYTAEKAFTPEFDLKDSENLKIVVVPVGIANSRRITRDGDWEEDLVVQVGVHRRVQPNAGTPVNPEDILGDSQTVRKHLKDNPKVTNTATYTLTATDYEAFYDYEELEDSHRVLSVITARYKEFTV